MTTFLIIITIIITPVIFIRWFISNVIIKSSNVMMLSNTYDVRKIPNILAKIFGLSFWYVDGLYLFSKKPIQKGNPIKLTRFKGHLFNQT
jgi:hypothetical protein